MASQQDVSSSAEQHISEYVAVPAALRGRGHGRILLDAHLARARTHGHTQVAISAMYGNAPALRAYLRCGFREHARLGPERFGGAFPGIVRLVCDLPAAAGLEAAASRPVPSLPG